MGLFMNKEFLRRYTELRYVLQLLRTGKLAFLDPSTWDDRNDSHFLNAYRDAKKWRSLRAVCFTRVSERHHHWERFATRGQKVSGETPKRRGEGRETVCVEFDKEKLLASFSGNAHIKNGAVRYSKLNVLEQHPPRLDRWPFLKRYPYRDEKEFRIIVASTTPTKAVLMLPISLGAIERIIIGPYPDLGRREKIKQEILSVRVPRGPITVTKTTILDNLRWKKIVDRARETAN
jgi:hypothetical protein